jgi:hypothetical protein
MCEDQEVTFDKRTSNMSFAVGKEVQVCRLGVLGSCHFFLMSPNSIFLAQMDVSIVGKKVENFF